jgi:hypothetical protein
MGQRYSLLHLLSHDQQLDVYRTHTRLETMIRPQKRPDFESLPPEIRAMIFEKCIREHGATSAYKNLLKEAAQYVITTKYMRSWVKHHPRFNKFPLRVSYILETFFWLVECWVSRTFDACVRHPYVLFLLVCGIASGAILTAMPIEHPRFLCSVYASAMVLILGEHCSRQGKTLALPRKKVWHEVLAIWVVLKNLATLPWRGLVFLRTWKLLLWYDYAAQSIDYVDENHLRDFIRTRSSLPDPGTVHIFHDQPAEVYDLPIFFLNRGLRSESLELAKILGHGCPPPRSRRMLSNSPNLLSASDRDCRDSWRRLISEIRARWCELMSIRIYQGGRVPRKASGDDEDEYFKAWIRPLDHH